MNSGRPLRRVAQPAPQVALHPSGRGSAAPSSAGRRAWGSRSAAGRPCRGSRAGLGASFMAGPERPGPRWRRSDRRSGPGAQRAAGPVIRACLYTDAMPRNMRRAGRRGQAGRIVSSSSHCPPYETAGRKLRRPRRKSRKKRKGWWLACGCLGHGRKPDGLSHATSVELADLRIKAMLPTKRCSQPDQPARTMAMRGNKRVRIRPKDRFSHVMVREGPPSTTLQNAVEETMDGGALGRAKGPTRGPP